MLREAVTATVLITDGSWRWQYLRVRDGIPPALLIRKALRKAAQPWRRQRSRRYRRLLYRGAWSMPAAGGDLFGWRALRLLPQLPDPQAVRECLEDDGLLKAVQALAAEVLAHRFDLLGSGPVKIGYDAPAAGFHGFQYDMSPGKKQAEITINRIRVALFGAGGGEPADTGRKVLQEKLAAYSPLDWHRDFRSGHRWDPELWYRDVPLGHRQGVDIKVPWELSRFQHLAVLGLDYYAGSRQGDEELAAEFVLQLADWIVTNPPECGVNWYCTMEAAIRAVNWLWGLAFFKDSLCLTPAFRRLLSWSLAVHARHLRANLENEDAFVGNHYLANLAGLIYLECACPWLPGSDRWLSFAMRELAGEMKRQFYLDGMNFEASTGYHRLAAEMYYSATTLLMRLPKQRRERLRRYLAGSGINPDLPQLFPGSYFAGLYKMAEAAAALTRPDGTVPQLGDFDNGRLHKLVPVVELEGGLYRERHHDFRPLMAVGGELFEQERLKKISAPFRLEGELMTANLPRQAVQEARKAVGRHDPAAVYDVRPAGNRAENSKEVFWPPVITRLELLSPAPDGDQEEAGCRYFEDGGIAVLRHGPVHLTVSCGSSGAEGWGGHAHNDKLSFVLNLFGLDFITDPGSYVYTALPAERNLFRSTRAHNTLYLPGIEQNEWPDGLDGLFVLPDNTTVTVTAVAADYFAAVHRGYGPLHRREFSVSCDRVLIKDSLETLADVEFIFNLHPAVAVEEQESGSFLLRREQVVLLMTAEQAGERLPLVVEDGFYAPCYGKKQAARRLVCRCYAKRLYTSVGKGEN